MLTLSMNRRRWISKPSLIAMETQNATPERMVHTAQSRKVMRYFAVTMSFLLYGSARENCSHLLFSS